MKPRGYIVFGLVVLGILVAFPALAVEQERREAESGDIPLGRLSQALLAVNYAGYEELRYDISWTGGIKIGELMLRVRPLEEPERFRIIAKVQDYGVFRFFYPVNDTFITDVQGPQRLPSIYKVHQLEGHGGAETRRLTRYDQQGLKVYYRRDQEPEQVFTISGPVQNEFSSFFGMRAMPLDPGNLFLVPTFSDGKRHEVRVQVLGREQVDSIFGLVQTVKVLPKMEFRGLYDKNGDTVIWFTDDPCRVPVRINSRILIGSLTAELVGYVNPFCADYPAVSGGGKREP